MDAWDQVYRISTSDSSYAPDSSGSARPSSELDHGAYTGPFSHAQPPASSSGHQQPQQQQEQQRRSRRGLSGIAGGAFSGPTRLPSLAFGNNRDADSIYARDEYDDEKGLTDVQDLHHQQRHAPTLAFNGLTSVSSDNFTSRSHGPGSLHSQTQSHAHTLGLPQDSTALPTETHSAVAPGPRQRDKRRARANHDSPLALVEKRRVSLLLGLTWGEIKLLTLAGAGFMMDAYDLFIINMIYPILLRVYYPADQTQLDWGLSGGVLKASANIGNVVGQLAFGFFGDFWGRSVLYGKELILVIVAVILVSSPSQSSHLAYTDPPLLQMISAPDHLGGFGVTVWMCVFRVIMGIGIGGDYPLSACIVADRASLKNRGLLLAFIFSNQGWGTLTGAIISIIVITAYRGPVERGDLHMLTGAWRIMQGVVIAPALVVLYFRLTLVESTRFVQARFLQDNPDFVNQASAAGMVVVKDAKGEEIALGDYKQQHMSRNFSRPLSPSVDRHTPGHSPLQSIGGVHTLRRIVSEPAGANKGPSAHEIRKKMREAVANARGWNFHSVGLPHNDFWDYFSQWRHLRLLLGTALAWFLVDITFYGINLNQSSILSLIGFTQGPTVYDRLFKVAVGNVIVTVAGYLPGYFLTVGCIEILGRKKIQMMGFTINAIMFLILALLYHKLEQNAAGFFVVFVILQLSFNFGANATTFIIPAETFPTRIVSCAFSCTVRIY